MPSDPQTFILAYVFERKCQARILPLDDSDLSKSTFAHDTEKPEVIEVDFVRVDHRLALRIPHDLILRLVTS